MLPSSGPLDRRVHIAANQLAFDSRRMPAWFEIVRPELPPGHFVLAALLALEPLTDFRQRSIWLAWRRLVDQTRSAFREVRYPPASFRQSAFACRQAPSASARHCRGGWPFPGARPDFPLGIT